MIGYNRLKTIYLACGGAVTVVWQTDVQIVTTPPTPSKGDPIYYFGHAGNADSLDDWHVSLKKRAMSRLIQVRQLYANKFGFVLSATGKYMVGRRYR